MNNPSEAINSFLQNNPWIIVLAIWEIVWKGVALYKSARNRQHYWYVALLIINTVGILPILYILFFQKNKNTRAK
jgi:hypothetical protein